MELLPASESALILLKGTSPQQSAWKRDPLCYLEDLFPPLQTTGSGRTCFVVVALLSPLLSLLSSRSISSISHSCLGKLLIRVLVVVCVCVSVSLCLACVLLVCLAWLRFVLYLVVACCSLICLEL